MLSSHVSLLSGVALDIYGLSQPRFDQTTTGADLVAVERWFEQLIRVRKGLQIVWVMSTLACDRESVAWATARGAMARPRDGAEDSDYLCAHHRRALAHEDELGTWVDKVSDRALPHPHHGDDVGVEPLREPHG